MISQKPEVFFILSAFKTLSCSKKNLQVIMGQYHKMRSRSQRLTPIRMGSIAIRLFFILVVFLTFNIPVYGANLIVPDDYNTIQSAVDAASEDDIITVRAGTYYGLVHIYNKNISLKSISGADSTIIDAQNDSAAVAFNNVGSSTVLDGFTLTNGLRGIYINGSPSVKNCIIVNNGGVNPSDCTKRS